MYRIRMPRGWDAANSWRQAKRAVNQTLDGQGFYAAIQSVFDIHQTGHGNALSVTGYPVITRLEGGAGQHALRGALNRTLVASIGPVASSALREAKVKVGLESKPPKLGALLSALDSALS